MKKKKGTLSTALLIAVFLVGLSLLLYPTVSNWWNQHHQTQVIANYQAAVAELDDTSTQEMLAAAQQYNNTLAQRVNRYEPTEEEEAQYQSLLNVGEDGVMGYLEIDAIDVSLPIYHGTGEEVLAVGVGHLESSSLPIGGSGTHTVLSGHRGLPSAKLFTDLDQLTIGDTFVIRVLSEVLTYEVDQIVIVEPEDVTDLEIVEGEDYCTLLTCTPYGINSHRLLVRGHRIETEEDKATYHLTADGVETSPLLAASVVAVPMLLILLIVLLVSTRRRKKMEE
jgi:sortase A